MDMPKPLTDNLKSDGGNKRFKTFAEETKSHNPAVAEAITFCK